LGPVKDPIDREDPDIHDKPLNSARLRAIKKANEVDAAAREVKVTRGEIEMWKEEKKKNEEAAGQADVEVEKLTKRLNEEIATLNSKRQEHSDAKQRLKEMVTFSQGLTCSHKMKRSYVYGGWGRMAQDWRLRLEFWYSFRWACTVDRNTGELVPDVAKVKIRNKKATLRKGQPIGGPVQVIPGNVDGWDHSVSIRFLRRNMKVKPIKKNGRTVGNKMTVKLSVLWKMERDNLLNVIKRGLTLPNESKEYTRLIELEMSCDCTSNVVEP
jgi:hypothetical protein